MKTTITAPSQHEPLNTRGTQPECASPTQGRSRHPTAARRDVRPINRAQRLRLLAGLVLGHLVELVLALCVAHANANTGAHAGESRSRHRCACPWGVSASARACASARPAACVEHGLTHARHTARHAAAAVRRTTLSGLCVCQQRGALRRTEHQEPTEGAQDGAVRQLADGVFYARVPQLRHLPSRWLTPQLQSSELTTPLHCVGL